MNLKNGLTELVKNNDAREAFYNIAEVALDTICDDGILKNIPLIGTLVKSGQAILTIKDRIFIKKVQSFLRSLEDVDTPTKSEFIQKLENKDEREKTGEKLILIIDRQDSLEKAELIGWIFRALLLEKIQPHVFEMLCHAVTNSYIGDLENLPQYSKTPRLIEEDLGFKLMAAGLAKLDVNIVAIDGGSFVEYEDDGKDSATRNDFELTDLGDSLSSIIEEWCDLSKK